MKALLTLFAIALTTTAFADIHGGFKPVDPSTYFCSSADAPITFTGGYASQPGKVTLQADGTSFTLAPNQKGLPSNVQQALRNTYAVIKNVYKGQFKGDDVYVGMANSMGAKSAHVVRVENKTGKVITTQLAQCKVVPNEEKPSW